MISVCVATHNGAAYIKNQIDSILCQLNDGDEIIISDDGSTDATIPIIKSIRDIRIKILCFKQPSKSSHTHEYVCRNFQNALMHAEGDYIFLSDQDDIWMSDKVEVCMNALREHDLVLHDFMHIDENENITQDLHYDGTFRRNNYFLRAGKHFGCAMAFKRKVLDYALPFPSHLLLHDYWIGILAETLGSFYYEKRPLIRYRIHQENTSGNHNPLWFMVYYRVVTFIWVLCRVIRYRLDLHHYLDNNECNNR